MYILLYKYQKCNTCTHSPCPILFNQSAPECSVQSERSRQLEEEEEEEGAHMYRVRYGLVQWTIAWDKHTHMHP